MARITVDLDDDLVADALSRSGLATVPEVVEVALRRLVGPRRSSEFTDLKGIGWDGDLDEMRRTAPGDRSVGPENC